jgi:hypothetical protein
MLGACIMGILCGIALPVMMSSSRLCCSVAILVALCGGCERLHCLSACCAEETYTFAPLSFVSTRTLINPEPSVL